MLTIPKAFEIIGRIQLIMSNLKLKMSNCVTLANQSTFLPAFKPRKSGISLRSTFKHIHILT